MGGFQKAALAKGYAFASSNERWSRVTIKDHPEDALKRVFARRFSGQIRGLSPTNETFLKSRRGMYDLKYEEVPEGG
jgi:hypothetical protein